MEALLQKYNEGLEESSNILDKTDKSISTTSQAQSPSLSRRAARAGSYS